MRLLEIGGTYMFGVSKIFCAIGLVAWLDLRDGSKSDSRTNPKIKL